MILGPEPNGDFSSHTFPHTAHVSVGVSAPQSHVFKTLLHDPIQDLGTRLTGPEIDLVDLCAVIKIQAQQLIVTVQVRQSAVAKRPPS